MRNYIACLVALFSFPVLVVHPITADVDVLIIGAGVAGSTAAAFLADTDLDVTVWERSGEVGGLLRGSNNVAGIWVPRTLEDAYYLQSEVPDNIPKMSNDDVAALQADGVKAIDSLVERGALDELALSDKKAYYGSSKSMYYMRPHYSVTEYLYAALVSAGLHNFIGAPGKNLYSLIAKGKDGLVWMPSHIRRLCHTFLQTKLHHRIPLKLHTKLISLEKSTNDDGSVLWTAKGHYKYSVHLQVLTAKHVIFASGGYMENTEARAERDIAALIPHAWHKGHSSGVLQDIARKEGWPMCSASNPPVYHAEAIKLNNHDTSVLLFLNGPSLMVVNKSGNRVYNEKLPYARRGDVNLKEGGLILITDGKNLYKNSCTPTPLLAPYKESRYLPSPHIHHVWMRASSVKDLAAKMEAAGWTDNVDFNSTFQSQLTRFNTYARDGVDPEFNRHEFQRIIEPEGLSPMAPIDTTDLYAVQTWPSALDTCSGPQMDRDTSLIVDGVYAAGNAACSATNGFYLSPGVPSFSAIVQAYRAARHIRKLEGERSI